MKRTLLAFVLLAVGLYAQGQSVNYKIIKDDPYDIKGNAICIDPFYADTWGTDVNLGLGVRADAMLWKLATFYVDLRKAYLDINARSHADGSLPKPEKKLKKHLYFEVGGALTLIDRTKNKSMKVVLSSTSSGNYTYTKYIMVPGTLRKITQVRAGITTTRAAFDLGDTKDDGKTFTATAVGDTGSFTFGDFGNSVDGSATYGGYSMMNMVIINAGISKKRITNLMIDTDYSRRGKRGNTLYYDFFLDALFAPVIAFSDVYTSGGKRWELSTTEMKRTGWRFGVSARSSSQNFLTYKFEFGSRPGFRGDKGLIGGNAYLMLTMGWSIPVKLKFLNAKEG